MNKERFKFKTVVSDKVYVAQKTQWESKDYYIILWDDEGFHEHDTGIGAYVWEVSEVEERINENVWIVLD
jgi:hypothetical protein